MLKVRRLFEGGIFSRAAFTATTVNLWFFSKLILTNSNTSPKKLRIKSRRINIQDCFRFNVVLVMNASNKRPIDEKKCGVYSRTAFIRGRRLIILLLVPAAFIPGRRLFEGGVYSSNYGNTNISNTDNRKFNRPTTRPTLKPVTGDEQVFYDKFSHDKFYLPSARVYMQHILYDKFSYDKFYFTGVNVSTSLLRQVFFVNPYRRAKFVL